MEERNNAGTQAYVQSNYRKEIPSMGTHSRVGGSPRGVSGIGNTAGVGSPEEAGAQGKARPMTKARTLESDLDKLAKKIASDVLKPDVAFSDRLDAFKALSNYHIAERKVAQKSPPPDDDMGSSLDAIRKRINEAEIDGEAVQ